MARERRASEITLTHIAPTFTSVALTSILPFSNDCFSANSYDNLQWYSWWVHQEVQAQPKELFSTISAGDSESDVRWTKGFGRVWQETARFLTMNKSGSIDEVIAHLIQNGCIQSTSDPNSHLTMNSLVFAILGWQTMLYQPDIRSCPFSQLAIRCQMGLHQGQCHMSLKQGQSACKKSMHEFLLGYGMLLPPRQFCVPETAEEKEAFKRQTTVSPESFNAYFLTVFGGINITWVDSLPCHLEFDSDSNTLFLFRYPSYCLMNLESNGGSSQTHKSVLHACAISSATSTQWATQEEITQLLKETILSFRLLFGQNRASRKLYASLEPFKNIPNQGIDPFLTSICAQKRLRTSVGLSERDSYELHRDFPILRSRLSILTTHLSSKKPRTWREHWLDKRDSASWLTFWAVIIIGGMGIILAFLQVILQIIQIAKS
ncbi:hypothetical protein BJ878DRAFT_191868 [Calycina marina]|uniref:Uncharacterized protein n=1 Tax=Calycina marina TaxID=1763456 RepID=A0A9P7YZJ8_9HELO|nr:hypothetical protein BJ878DRAFT_191868 [Calycina marina]